VLGIVAAHQRQRVGQKVATAGGWVGHRGGGVAGGRSGGEGRAAGRAGTDVMIFKNGKIIPDFCSKYS
jgi:hypothetical protein